MKVNSDIAGLQNMIRTGTGVEHQVQTAQQNTFRHVMSSLNQNNYMQKLTEMGQDIAKQGEILGRRYDILELKRFKEMVAEYLYEAVRFMYEFKKQNMMDPRGRHKMYAIIKKINVKLEEMTKALLSEEKDNLELMSAIGDIRGMLLDILL